MAQFDVYKNPSQQSRQIFPLLLDIQHEVIEHLDTRLVIPLAKPQYFKNQRLNILMPQVTWQEQSLLLVTPQLSSIAIAVLGQPIGTLRALRSDIIAALDFAVTGI